MFYCRNYVIRESYLYDRFNLRRTHLRIILKNNKSMHTATASVHAESGYLSGDQSDKNGQGRRELTGALQVQSRHRTATSKSVNRARAVESNSPKAEHVALAHKKPINRYTWLENGVHLSDAATLQAARR